MAKIAHAGPLVPLTLDILHGGLARGFLYLIEGIGERVKRPGAAVPDRRGIARREGALHLAYRVRVRTSSCGRLSLVRPRQGDDLQDFAAGTGGASRQQYTVFQPAEVGLADVREPIFAKVRKVAPARVVIDSMSELRMMA